MAIPELQLETWSHQGAVVTAKSTHESIRLALTAPTSPLRGRDIEIYLQGSYRNATNIYGNSDVDVVVHLKEVFVYDPSDLPWDTQQRLANAIPQATYGWLEYRQDVVTALTSKYGSQAVDASGNKSIKLARDNGRLPADVVPCFDHRKITVVSMAMTYDYEPGICLYTTREQREVINYPKRHIANGQAKNGDLRTNGWYKPSVRMFKNVRTNLASFCGG